MKLKPKVSKQNYMVHGLLVIERKYLFKKFPLLPSLTREKGYYNQQYYF